MKRCGGVCFFVGMLLASTWMGETIQIPLPELVDCFFAGDRSPGVYTIPLDLQATFSQIDRVSLQVAGKTTPGFYFGEVSGSGPLIPGCVNFRFDPDPQMPGCWDIQLTNERFNTKAAFQNAVASDTWEFLLEGRGELICQVGPFADFPPRVYIFEAFLEVEGTVIHQIPRNNTFPLPGDANHDDRVDVGDLGVLAANYGRDDRPLTQQSYLDLNGDGWIEVGDLGVLAAQYGENELLIFLGTVTFEQGDFNYDGKVDVGDLGILAGNYGLGVDIQIEYGSDFAKAFGTAVAENDSAMQSDKATEDDGDNLSCPTVGLPLVLAGLFLMMFCRMQECE